MALAPWVLVPLVRVRDGGSPGARPRFGAGGRVRRRGQRRGHGGRAPARRALAADPPARAAPRLMRLVGSLVGARHAWWLVPLLLLGGYSPPFLDFIETAALTTFPTTIFEVAPRHLALGAVRRRDLAGRQRAGRQRTVSSSAPCCSSSASLGCSPARHPAPPRPGARRCWPASAGDVRPRRRRRRPGSPATAHACSTGRWRRCATCTSTTRSSGCRSRSGWRTCSARPPPRAAVGQRPRRPRATATAPVGARRSCSLLAIIALLGTATPALAGRSPRRRLRGRAGLLAGGRWLARRPPRPGTVLVVPASNFGDYCWGRTTTRCSSRCCGGPGRCATRSRWPAGHHPDAGRDRAADRHGRRSRAGRLPGPRRHQPTWSCATTCAPTRRRPRPVLVHQALDRLARHHPGPSTFGPEVGGTGAARVGRAGTALVDEGGWHAPYPAVEVYSVAGATDAGGRAGAAASSSGGPRTCSTSLDAGLLGDAPAVLAADAAEPGAEASARGPLLLTDGLRRREATFAPGARRSLRRPWRPTTTDGAAPRPATTVAADASRWETTARHHRRARRSPRPSSRAYADTVGPVLAGDASLRGRRRPTRRPQWESGPPRRGRTRGWQVDARRARPTSSRSRSSRASTGSDDDPDDRRRDGRPGRSRAVRGPGRRAGRRVRAGRCDVARCGCAPRTAVGLPAELAVAEVRAEGLDVDRTLVLPERAGGVGTARPSCSCRPGPSLDALRGGGGRRPLRRGSRADRTRSGGVIDRTVPARRRGGLRGRSSTVRPVAGDAPDRPDAAADQLVNVERLVDGRGRRPRLGAGGDRRRPGHDLARRPRTTTTRPWTLTWIGERPVRGAPALSSTGRQRPRGRPELGAWSHPTADAQVVRLDESGRAELEPFRATRVSVRVLEQERAYGRSRRADLEPAPGRRERAAACPARGCSRSDAVRHARSTSAVRVRARPLGVGRTPSFDEQRARPRRASSSTAEVAAGSRVRAARRCGLGARRTDAGSSRHPAPRSGDRGDHSRGPVPPRRQLAAPATRDRRRPRSAADARAAARAAVRRGAAATSTAGWRRRASRTGRAAPPVVVDGWQQGLARCPSDAGPVDLRYVPDRAYRIGPGRRGRSLLVLLALGALLLRAAAASRRPARRPAARAVAPCGGAASPVVSRAAAWSAGWWVPASPGSPAAAGVGAALAAGSAGPSVAWVAAVPVVVAALVYCVAAAGLGRTAGRARWSLPQLRGGRGARRRS